MTDFSKLRRNYPVTGEGVFLNHAATSPVSSRTVEAVQKAVAQLKEPLGKHFYQTLGIIEETRRILSELIGAHPSQIAFTPNTSTSISYVSQAIPFEPGDRVLVPSNEFPSNLYPWQNLKNKGVICDCFEVEKERSLLSTLSELDLRKVRLISISSVSYMTGRRIDSKAFATFCREQGILSCVDAIQEVGAISVNVKESGVDFLVGGAQKWLLGPPGCGYLYMRPELLNQLNVPVVGWTSVKYPENFSLSKLDFASEMTRFEPGLPDPLPIVGLNSSLKEFQTIGWENIYARIQAHVAYLCAALKSQGLELLGENENELTGIVSFRLPQIRDSRRLLEMFHKKNITVTVREDYIRVSPHFYSEKRELDQFLEALPLKKPFPALSPVKSKALSQKVEKEARILLTGATGVLGRELARLLIGQGKALLLLARDKEQLIELKTSLQPVAKAELEIAGVDLEDSHQIASFFQTQTEEGKGFSGFIHCAGQVESNSFVDITPQQVEAMFRVNTLAPLQIIRSLLSAPRYMHELKIMHIVSSTGRCGYPLLSVYAATQASLWTLGEALERELRSSGVVITTFVAPAMHSRMQKRMGRTALRYFKMSGEFDYAYPDQVALEALQAWEEKKALHICSANRTKLWANNLFPSRVSKKIERVWKTNEYHT